MTQLPPMDLYGALLFQVTGQQLSVAATRRTLARIEALFGGHLPSPAELLAVDPGQLREAGMPDQELFEAMVNRYPDWVSRQEFLLLGSQTLGSGNRTA